ncbi:MAG: ThuA domain-containing protein [Defluviitaleaceae bacterium]|nr:ThuA domain-containing protein [Defluviitaleaceae bacterium]
MRILLFCGEHYHPAEVTLGGIAPLKEKGFNFDIIKNGKDFNPNMLADYPVVLMAKCDEVSPEDRTSWKTTEIQQAFVEYVEKGGGLLVVHNGTVAGKDTAILDRLIGCRFKFHPNDCPVMVEPVKPHPITKNVGAFWEDDEHYHLEILAHDIDILMASYAPKQGSAKKHIENPYYNTPAKISPSGYVRTQGRGRVCVLAPGHHIEVWLNPYFQQALENAINWCGNIGVSI